MLTRVGCFQVALNHTAHLVPFEIVLAKHSNSNKVYDAINEEITRYVYNPDFISSDGYKVYNVVFDRVALKLHIIEKARDRICIDDLPYLHNVLNELEAILKRYNATDVWRQLPIDEFCIAPASTKYHHNYLGGLLVHTTEVIKIAVTMASLFGLNEEDMRDVVIAALLHDIGKIQCYTIQQPITSTDYNKQIGHIADGLQWVERISHYGIPLKKDDLTQMIISHHGRFDPTIQRDPATSKAWFVHFADLLSSQLSTDDPFTHANLYNIGQMAEDFGTVASLSDLTIETLLVDLDGTLISEKDPNEDHIEVFNGIVREALNEMNVKIPPHFNNFVYNLQEFEAKLKTVTPPLLLHKLTTHDINKMAPIIDINLFKSLPYKKILATQRIGNPRDVLAGMNLLDLFDEVIERVDKKHMAIIGFSPDSTVYVGDSASDVVCAFSSGFYCLTKKSAYDDARQAEPLINRYKKVFVVEDNKWHEWPSYLSR